MSIALVVEIIGDAAKLDASLNKAGGKASGFGGMIGGSALKVAAFAGVVGIAATAVIGMTQAAADDAAEQQKLEAAIKASGAATGDWIAQTDAAIATAQEKAFTDTQAREAMQSLVTATGSVTEAQTLMAGAMDIARFANVDLSVAADAVAKAQAGQDGPLRKLIPGLEKGASATDTLAAATSQAAGQADLYADSAAGMQERGSQAFDELTETIGSAFLPILEEILPVLIPIIKQFGELVKAILPLIIPLIKALAAQLRIMLTVISGVVGWVIKLVNWLTDAAEAVGDFLASINPLEGISLPSLPFLSAAPGGGGGASARGFGAAPLSAGVAAPLTVNVYTTGDSIEAEQAVVRAVRRVARINGGVVPALSWQGAR